MPWSVIMLDGGKRALSWSADETLRLWDMETDDRESVREDHTRSRNTAATLTSGINSVAILDDGKRALSGA
jgi:WD40 repeat protein